MSVPSETSRPPSRPWAIAVAILLAVPLTAGVVQAAIPDGDGDITVCYKPYTGYMRVIDTESVPKCASDESSLTWNSRPATKLWARVASNGKVEDQGGGISVDTPSGSNAGTYKVTFPQDVVHCAAVVSPTGFTGGAPIDRIASTGTGTGAANPATEILVRTLKLDPGTGAFINATADFNIAVFC